MKHLWMIGVLVLYVQVSAMAAPKNTVTTESLLLEMIDRDVPARYPDPYYSCRQSSSYDRATVAKDKNNWFANADRSFFLRAEDRHGRHEFVMMDVEGPGAIVRFWMTFAGPGAGQGTLRIYLDGAEDPVVEGPAMAVLSGDLLTREPLASSVSKLSPYGI